MEEFLEKPTEYLKNYHFNHGANFFLYNPQFVFFGYPSYLLKYSSEPNLRALVDNWIYQIDQDFDHILILERLDTSMAVMMIKFCWNVDDVINLKVRMTHNL